MTFDVAIADASDPRVRQAALALRHAGRVNPVLVCGDHVALPDGLERVSVAAGQSELDTMAAFVLSGGAAAGIAGSLSASADVIRAGIRGLGRRGLVTGCFAMHHSEKWTTYADCSVVPFPSVEQLADIAELAADHHERVIGDQARIAMLSFSTIGSAEHPHVDRVREATRILKKRRPELLVEGELQFDVAVDPVVARRKLPGSTVAGRANVLIFPNLEAGNIAYKVAERIGGARALGSFILNLSHPWVDLSRGCSVEDIINTVNLLAGRACILEKRDIA